MRKEALAKPHCLLLQAVFIFFSILFLAACPSFGGELAAKAPVKVVCSIEPLRFFVSEIGGPLVEAEVMVPPGASPATYEPRPRQMAALAGAKIYFASGVPFEQAWLDRFRGQNPSLKIVDVNQGIRLLPMDHKHSKAPEKGRENLDPHTWLSPPLALLIARNIFAALYEALPGMGQQLSERYAALAERIARLDGQIMEILAGIPPEFRVLPTFHPAWGYFARAYGFRQIPVEMEGKEPSPRQLDALSRRLKAIGAHFILVQPQFSQRSARALASMCGLRLITADPLSSSWDEGLLKLARTVSALSERGENKKK